jgi:hypothetical protein
MKLLSHNIMLNFDRFLMTAGTAICFIPYETFIFAQANLEQVLPGKLSIWYW